METDPFLGLQQGKADPLADLETQCAPADLILDSGDQSPHGLDAAVTFPRPPTPRQESLQGHDRPSTPERNDSEEIITYISENMTVTSADEEKLLLLNKNTELRRINKELMKLNQDWGCIYHTTSLGLQHKVEALKEEVATLRMQVQKLSAKLEHEQSKREYYEQSLFQELKRSQALQDYMRRLEGQQLRGQEAQPAPESKVFVSLPWEEFTAPQHLLPRKSSKENVTKQHKAPSPKVCGSESTVIQGHPDSAQQHPDSITDAGKEVTNLRDQLKALMCQTEIYAAEYRMEQKDRQRIKAENSKLQKKQEDMKQQIALLEEQLRIFEDDFWMERSDKQVLQRLLKRNPEAKEPLLVHRCNGHEKPSVPRSPPPRPGGHWRCKHHTTCKKCNMPPHASERQNPPLP